MKNNQQTSMFLCFPHFFPGLPPLCIKMNTFDTTNRPEEKEREPIWLGEILV